MEGGSNGHRSYETDFSVRYLAGAVVVVVVHAAVILVFVVVIVAVVALALLRVRGALALALKRDLDRIDGRCMWAALAMELSTPGFANSRIRALPHVHPRSPGSRPS